MKTLYLAGGCFWGMQRFLDQFQGVRETETGYANGPTENPTYQEVCQDSGHAETVKVVFDEQLLPPEKLLDYYFMAIDPLSLNKQGEDEGIQYRTGIYWEDDSLVPVIKAKAAELSEKLGTEIMVEIAPLENFYSAEEYHQKYLVKNPTGYCHINPALFRLEQES